MKRSWSQFWILGVASIVIPLVFVSLFTNFSACADEDPPSCSIGCTFIVKQVKGKESKEDWSFILLQEINGESTYHRLPFVPSNGEGSNDYIETVGIREAKNVVEGNHYEIYEGNYTGKKEVSVGLLAVKRNSNGSSLAAFNSKKLTFDCRDFYPEEPGGISMLGKEEFTVTVNGSGNRDNPKSSWKVSLISHQSAYNPGINRAEGIINATGVTLWLGLATYLLITR